METVAAKKLVQETLQSSFNKEHFVFLIKNVLNHIEEAPFTYKGNYIFDDFADSIKSVERIGKYKDPEEKLIDILVVHLQKKTSLERARTKQRNFVAKYLKGSRGGVLKDAALVAFVAPNGDDWRFSLVKMEYKFNEKGKVEEEFTPARRSSFLVGKNENSHTAQSRLLPVLLDDEVNPTLKELEEVFSVERVSKEFFEKYRDLVLRLKESLDEVVKNDVEVKADLKEKNVETVDFAKKLLGQIVFLYFLQKKGWFGVKRRKEWGSGSKRFLRELFEKRHGDYKNFFNDIMEPLFYEALRLERPGDYYSRFDCRIPFLNGGLFDPINDYDWWNTDILLPDEVFSNDRKTKEGDTGDGILDICDRYNFTVKEDEPLEKEVAVDPEMLGRVFENLLEVKDRKSKGTYYTPREIVHYMCQESLANYLATELDGKMDKRDIETLIKYGETVVEHDSRVMNEGRETKTYAFKLPQSVRKHAKLIDETLESIRVCDPAVGSGAFLVGMMNETIRTRNALTAYIEKDGERTPYNFKRHAIQNSLYGVDIDPGAVEIAKLRFWLSLIVDEEERETIQPLPNLDYKIMQGNSLLDKFEGVKLFDEKLITAGADIAEGIAQLKERQLQLQQEYLRLHAQGQLSQTKQYELQAELKKLDRKLKALISEPEEGGEQTSLWGANKARQKAEQLKTLHKAFFEATQKRKKDQIKKQIESLEWELIEVTLREQGKEDSLSKLEDFKSNNAKPFFLWKLNFAEVFQENNGFDVVIANPPWVFTRGAGFDASFKKYIFENYLKYLEGSQTGRAKQSGKINLFAVFILKSLSLLKKDGCLTYIIPNTLLRATVYDGIRKFFLDNYRILNIVDLSSGRFAKVTASTIVLILQHSKPHQKHEVEIIDHFDSTDTLNPRFIPQNNFSKNISYTFNIYSTSVVDKIVEKVSLSSMRLGKYFDIFCGIATGPNKNNYIRNKPQTNQYKPLIEGKDVGRYRVKFNNKYILYDRTKLHRAREENIFLSPEKLITQRISGGSSPLVVAYDNKQFYTFNSTNSILPKSNGTLSVKYLLALLNSRFLNWYYWIQFTNKSTLTVNISKTFLEQLPIKELLSKDQQPFVNLVDKILSLAESRGYFEDSTKQAKVHNYEKQIDQLVYKLYGLTPEEIKIVENS